MHQVRYFLAVARLRNFTRAAEACNVAQPSLTRAVKLLEHELGGELLRRERGRTHLTPLGERMLPLLEKCYESAASAKAIATAMRSRTQDALRLALPHSVDIAPFLSPHLAALLETFDGLALKLLRGDTKAVAAHLEEGRADLAIAAPRGMAWERFESWPLFVEPMRLLFAQSHRFANRRSVALDELTVETLVRRRYCEDAERLEAALRERGADLSNAIEAGDDRDLLALIEAGAGVAFAPSSLARPATIRDARLSDLALARELRLYAVQGRRRGPAAAMLTTQLRAADWSGYAAPDDPAPAPADTAAATA